MGKSFLVKLRTFLHGKVVVHGMRWYYVHIYGMDIGINTRISSSVRLDKTNPRGIHIGKHSALAFDAAILSHDFINSEHLHTYIGDYCFIGAKAVVMPGRRIGNHCIIGTGAVVMKDVPDGSVVIGNPGVIVERGIKTTIWGHRIKPAISAVENSEVSDAGRKNQIPVR